MVALLNPIGCLFVEEDDEGGDESESENKSESGSEDEDDGSE